MQQLTLEEALDAPQMRDYSRDEIAARLKVSRSAVQQWISEERRPKPQHKRAIRRLVRRVLGSHVEVIF
jgi:DNA-binding transcriptional regulator YiaG